MPKLYRFATRFPKLCLCLAIALGISGYFLIRNLQFVTDFSSLLPADAESVRSLHSLEKNFGNLRYLVVAVESENRPEAIKYAEKLSAQLRELPQIKYVDYKGPTDFFLSRVWLYLEQKDIEEVAKRVERSLELEKNKVSSSFSYLMDFADPEDRPDLTFEDIFRRYEGKFLSSKQDQSDDQNAFEIIWVKPNQNSDDLSFNQALLNDIKALDSRLRLENPEFKGKIGYAGSYASSLEETALITKEVAWVSTVVTLALFLILIIYFRNFSSVFLIGFPLVLGALWTGGILYLALGHLNLITSFGAAILGGLGSDYGIFLLTRFLHERSQGASFDEASRLTFENTGRATFGSMITTVGAFGALLLSRFGVFFELGVLGFVGLIMNYLAMMVVMPSLLRLMESWGRFRATSKKWKEFGEVDPSGIYHRLVRTLTVKRRYWVLGGYLAVILVSVFALPEQTHIIFQDGQLNTENLPSNRMSARVSEKNWGTMEPGFLMVHGKENEKKLLDYLTRLLDTQDREQLIFNKVVGISTFIPEDPALKREMVGEIAKKYEQLQLVNPDQKRKTLDSLHKTLASNDVSLKNLPIEVTRRFVSDKDPESMILYLFPNLKRNSSGNIDRYYEGIQTIKAGAPAPFFFIDGTFIQKEVTEIIRSEAPKGLAFILLFLAVFLVVTVRPILRAAMIYLHLLASLVLLGGLLWLSKIPLNIMNIGMIPIILGTGLDCFIHLNHRSEETGLEKALPYELPPIFISSLTSMVGFGGLVLTTSMSLRSVGWLVALGLGLVTVICAFIYPRTLLLLDKDKKNEVALDELSLYEK